MDGVITDTMPYHYKAWKAVLAEYGIHATHLDIYKREGQPGTSCLVELFDKYDKEYCDKLANEMLHKKEVLFKQIVKQKFIVGARSFIKRLARTPIKLGLVTGTARHEMVKILPEVIRNKFDVIVTGTDVNNGKPHPEPYQKAVDNLNICKTKAVVIENAPCGIQSARAAGLKCFAIETSLPKEYLHEATDVFHSMKHMCEKIEFNYCMS